MTCKNQSDENKVVVKESSCTKDFFVGAMVGGVVGALTALLFAPKPGKELVHSISEQANVLKEKGSELKGTVKEKGTEFISLARTKGSNISNVVTKQSNELLSKVKGSPSNVTIEPTEVEVIDAEQEESSSSSSSSSSQDEAIQLKLEETKKAFDETESKYNQ